MSNNNDLHVKWIENPEKIGEMIFTFDGEKVFNLFRDYPYALTKEQIDYIVEKGKIALPSEEIEVKEETK